MWAALEILQIIVVLSLVFYCDMMFFMTITTRT